MNNFNIIDNTSDEELTRWHLYTFLKSRNGKTDMEEIMEYYEGIDEEELTEGIEEYNQMAKGSRGYYKPLKLEEEK